MTGVAGAAAVRRIREFGMTDTCCIDRANHTELSEAIASMFSWYRNAVKCYVYLPDVSARKRDNNIVSFASEWQKGEAGFAGLCKLR